MNSSQSDFWNSRYSSTDKFVYGEKPNEFLEEELLKLKPGKIFLPADGEGRNSVFAAKNGWEVDAVDFSAEGKTKAIKLAAKNIVSINYVVADLNIYQPAADYYDAAAVIFLHMDYASTEIFAQKIINCLKPGGVLMMEVFSKNQLGKNSGGPQNADVLYSVEQIRNHYQKMKILMLEEKIIQLNESEFHNGEASVIRLKGMKE